MTNNFFKLLIELDSNFIQRQSLLSDEYKNVILNLISYVKLGAWTKSEISRIYCYYYDSSYDQFRKIFVENGFKDRSPVTIRSQISELSRNLCDMFGSCDDIFQSFLAVSGRASSKTVEEGKDFIEGLRLRLDVLFQNTNDDFISSLAINPHDIAVIDYTENCYDVEDCVNELSLLKFLSKESINAMLNGVDLNKLAFLLQTMNKPLLVSNRSERDGKSGKGYKINKLYVNKEKINILQKLSCIDVGSLKSDVNAKRKQSDESIPFRFSTIKELSGVVSDRMKSVVLSSDNEKAARNIERLKNLFKIFTKEGLERYLRSFTDGEITKAVEDYLK